MKRDGVETVVATDRFEYEIDAGRVPRQSSMAVPLSKNVPDAAAINAPISNTTRSSATLSVKAIYEKEVSIKEIAITIRNDIPEPEFTLDAPLAWNGREEIEIIPKITNLESLRSKGVDQLNYRWTVEGIAVLKNELPGRLLLRRAQGSGDMLVHVAIDNGGAAVMGTCRLRVQEPLPSQEKWTSRPSLEQEQPEDDQFIACERGKNPALRFGRLVYAGSLKPTVDMVFVRVYADDQLYKSEKVKTGADGRYSLEVPLKAALVKYRTEFGSITGDRETILHSAKNIVCGDAFLIVGQSNAVATDFGKENSLASTEWVRTYGATTTDPKGSRWQSWGNAEARSAGGKSEIGYWGLELGRRLVESEKIPICIVNGAQGGTRIDQHQRNHSDPTDPNTIYGRLLWRVQQAKLTHGIRGIIWHQGENDQGADGPTGGYGYETYRQYFVDLAASWKEDYPNVEHYYVFQIWPKACAMGIRGSDNRLREVQRRLPELFSQLSLLPTLGIQPPGGCHFPAAGYAEFAKLLHPMMQYHIYHRFVDSFEAPNLKRAYFASPRREEIHLEFDQMVVWSDRLVSQFHLEGEPKQVVSGSANANTIVLKLKEPTSSTTITYLDSAAWSQDNLLLGKNGRPAFSFCEVPIEPN